MKTISLFSFLVTIFVFMSTASTAALAGHGGDGSGGGDPRAARAVTEYGHKFTAWLLAYPHPEVDINAGKLLLNIDRVSKSLDTTTPLLRMFPVLSLQCFGAPKPGCTYRDHSIDIAGLYWDSPTTTDTDRCILAGTEFSRPQKNVSQLYEKVASICQKMYAQPIVAAADKDKGRRAVQTLESSETCKSKAGPPVIRTSAKYSREVYYYVCSAGAVLLADTDGSAVLEEFMKWKSAGAIADDKWIPCTRAVSDGGHFCGEFERRPVAGICESVKKVEGLCRVGANEAY